MSDIKFRVGERVYPLSERDATWLVDRLRKRNAELGGWEGEDALALAWAVELALEREEEKPLVLGLQHVAPILHIVHTEELPPSPQLIAFQDALRVLQRSHPSVHPARRAYPTTIEAVSAGDDPPDIARLLEELGAIPAVIAPAVAFDKEGVLTAAFIVHANTLVEAETIASQLFEQAFRAACVHIGTWSVDSHEGQER
jgi:hypothetical protein